MPKLESTALISIFLRDYLPQDKDANTYDCVPLPSLDHVWKTFIKLTSHLPFLTFQISRLSFSTFVFRVTLCRRNLIYSMNIARCSTNV
ncbi:hypothetical protein J3R82DRAFT_9049 [Butyriboletus roseoflavus]|nr:hypothetical protein J3R82DRAFT_9049 [Butyriboletus roseoflavus]